MNTSPTTRRLLRGTAAAAVLAVTLAGCSGGVPDVGSTSAGESAGGAVMTDAQRAGEAPRADTTRAASLLSTHVIQRADLTVHARDVGDALVRVRTLVADVQGVVADEHTETGRRGEPRRSTLTLRVPVDAFETVLGDLADLGVLGSQELSTEDVSTQVVDVEARIISAERTLRRIRELLEAADDFSDVLSLESELARREADLASLKAQQAYLEDQTSLSTIQLTLLRPLPKPQPPDGENTGFVGGLTVGWDALVGLVTVLLTAFGVLVPLLLLLLPAGLLAWWLLRRVVRRQPAASPPA